MGQAPSHQAEHRAPGAGSAYLSCHWHSQACALRAEGLAAGRCPPAKVAPFWKDMNIMRHRRVATRGCLHMDGTQA